MLTAQPARQAAKQAAGKLWAYLVGAGLDCAMVDTNDAYCMGMALTKYHACDVSLGAEAEKETGALM